MNHVPFVRKSLILIASAMFLFGSSQAQINNDGLNYNYRPDSSRVKQVYLSLQEFSYLRNYEFFNDVQDGYTLFGTHLTPQLFYYPDSNLLISGGVFLRKDFGNEGIKSVMPLFSIRYQKKYFGINAGVINGSTHHNYIEPLYDVERRLLSPNEYGTQFVYDNGRWKTDVWINWLQMQYKYDNKKEMISGGLSAAYHIVKNEHHLLALPYQMIAYHRGGQIDTVSLPLLTYFNQTLGLRYEYTRKGFVKGFSASAYSLMFTDKSNASAIVFQNGGHAWHSNINIATRWGSLSLSYYNGRNFYAPLGMPLYQSISNKINMERTVFSHRQLLFARYAYQQYITPHLYLDVRFEPYVDLEASTKKMEFYHSVFLVYKQEIRLSK